LADYFTRTPVVVKTSVCFQLIHFLVFLIDSPFILILQRWCSERTKTVSATVESPKATHRFDWRQLNGITKSVDGKQFAYHCEEKITENAAR